MKPDLTPLTQVLKNSGPPDFGILRYTVFWSPEDKAFVARVDDGPYVLKGLSGVEDHPVAALASLREAIHCLTDPHD